MADQTQDISNEEDIGERLDALLNELETSTKEVAQTGASLEKSLDELAAAEAVSLGDGPLGDGGKAVKDSKSAKPKPPAPSSEASGEQAVEEEAAAEQAASSDGEPEAEAETQAETATESEPETASETEPGSEAETEAESGPEAQAGSESEPQATEDEADRAKPEQAGTEQDEPEQDEPEQDESQQADSEHDAESGSPEPQAASPDGAEATPDASVSADAAEPEPQTDDGLLIEPESLIAKPASEDVDEAPAGPTNLEEELDEELDALLASGMFEDPLEGLEADESAKPVDLPDDAQGESAQAKSDASAQGEERKSSPPTDEAELIGELDEQLAALADAELAEGDGPSPVPEAPPHQPSVAVKAADVNQDSKGEDAEGDGSKDAAAQPAKTPKAAPARPAQKRTPAERAAAWKARLAVAVERLRPMAERAWAQGYQAAIQAATRANAPLKDRPHLKQVVGWVALVHVFYAACLWAYVVVWHDPSPPEATSVQPTIEGQAGQGQAGQGGADQPGQ